MAVTRREIQFEKLKKKKKAFLGEKNLSIFIEKEKPVGEKNPSKDSKRRKETDDIIS